MTEKKFDYKCPTCDGFQVTKTWREHTFSYGSEDQEFTVEVPVFECHSESCDGPEWMDWESDEIRDAYIDQWKNDHREK